MKPNTILIGCKLPNGIKFKGSDGEYIHINGLNTSLIVGAGFGLTHVDAGEWAIFTATHTDFAPLLTNAIFTCESDKVADIASMGDELAGERTGFEGLDPTRPAPNLKPENEKAVKEAVQAKRTSNAKTPQSKADKAAALELAATLGDK